MKLRILVVVPFLLSLGCVYIQIDEDTIKNYSNQSLCDFAFSDQYYVSFREREIIYKEMEIRGIQCAESVRIIHQ